MRQESRAAGPAPELEDAGRPPQVGIPEEVPAQLSARLPHHQTRRHDGRVGVLDVAPDDEAAERRSAGRIGGTAVRQRLGPVRGGHVHVGLGVGLLPPREADVDVVPLLLVLPPVLAVVVVVVVVVRAAFVLLVRPAARRAVVAAAVAAATAVEARRTGGRPGTSAVRALDRRFHSYS